MELTRLITLKSQFFFPGVNTYSLMLRVSFSLLFGLMKCLVLNSGLSLLVMPLDMYKKTVRWQVKVLV